MNYPNISGIDSQRLFRGKERNFVLRPGQIIQGEIMKLYPNDIAEVRLGNHRILAKLKVGLELANRYFFQVASNTEYPELRVVGKPLKGVEPVDIAKLLNQLGLKSNKQHEQLVQSLLKHSIPFDRKEIFQAAELIKGEKNKRLAVNLIVEMFSRKLPLTNATFESMKAIQLTTVTDQLQTVLQQLASKQQVAQDENQHQLEQRLYDVIRKLTVRPTQIQEKLMTEITSEIQSGRQGLFHSLKSFGFIPSHIDFNTWSLEWKRFLEKHPDASRQEQKLPFRLHGQDFLKVTEKISTNNHQLIESVNQLKDKWDVSIHSGKPLSREMTIALHTDLQKVVFPFVSKSQQALLTKLPTSGDLFELYRSLLKFVEEKQFIRWQSLALQTNIDEQFLQQSPKQQFLDHLRLYLSSFGLNYEHTLIEEKEPSTLLQSVKGMLLQYIANIDTIHSEQPTRLLHLIQGLQLQSLNETPAFIQATLQLPAERLGLIKDLKLEFEGKKHRNGKLDPDYCRILFYLQLEGIDETVIDVNIQQRAISLTIFNNTIGLEAVIKRLKDQLSDNLQALNYRLTSISFKKLEENERKPIKNVFTQQQTFEGVDFRI